MLLENSKQHLYLDTIQELFWFILPIRLLVSPALALDVLRVKGLLLNAIIVEL